MVASPAYWYNSETQNTPRFSEAWKLITAPVLPVEERQLDQYKAAARARSVSHLLLPSSQNSGTRRNSVSVSLRRKQGDVTAGV